MFKFSVTPAKAGVPLPSRWFKNSGIPAFAGMTMLLIATQASAQEKQPPYWASIASGQAMTTAVTAKVRATSSGSCATNSQSAKVRRPEPTATSTR